MQREGRKESRGAHAHENYLDRDDENWWMKYTLVYFDKDEGMTEANYGRNSCHYTLDEDECKIVVRSY